MNRGWLLVSCAIAAVLIAGCGVSTRPSDYVGEYVFQPRNVPTAEFASFLVLKSDGTAFEVHYSGSTGQVLTVQTTWYLHQGRRLEVIIDNRAYPTDPNCHCIRLFIDAGYVDGESRYYEKYR
jgi:hypothetical protein